MDDILFKDLITDNLTKINIDNLVDNYNDYSDLTNNFQSKICYLNKMNKLKAISIFSKFPLIFEEFENSCLVHLFSLVGSRMLSWELNFPYNMRDTGLYYEEYANLSALRYKIIFRMFELNELPLNPNLIWLLSEYSIFLEMISNTQSADEKNRRNSKFIKNNYSPLDISINSSSPTTIKELIENMYFSVDMQARELAIKYPEFDRNYYAPYIKALKTWNKLFKKPGNQILRITPKKKKSKG